MFAILVIAGFPAATGILGWFELQDVARTQSRVVTEAIPAISDVRGVAEGTSRVVAVAPELSAVTGEAQRAERAAYLLGQVDALRDRLTKTARSPAPTEALAAEAAVRQAILTLDALVRQRIRVTAQRDATLQRALDATVELTGIADTLVANAAMGTSAVISNLYDLETESPGDRQARFDALDRLIEVDLFQLGLMFELRAHASEIGLLLNRIVAASTGTIAADNYAATDFDFNTPGQYTNAPYNLVDNDWMNNAIVNAQPFGPVVPFEVSTGGVGVATGGGGADPRAAPDLRQRVVDALRERHAEPGLTAAQVAARLARARRAQVWGRRAAGSAFIGLGLLTAFSARPGR